MTLLSTQNWTRDGVVLARNAEGPGSEVVGDPCIVWDPEINGWRMILFFSPPGHASSVSFDPTGAPGTWSAPEPLTFTNPELFPAGYGTHKPFIIMDAHRPNRAAYVDGRYWLLLVNVRNGGSLHSDRESVMAAGKYIHRAYAAPLAGP